MLFSKGLAISFHKNTQADFRFIKPSVMVTSGNGSRLSGTYGMKEEVGSRAEHD